MVVKMMVHAVKKHVNSTHYFTHSFCRFKKYHFKERSFKEWSTFFKKSSFTIYSIMFLCRIKIQIITFIVYIYVPYGQQHTLAARFDYIHTNKLGEKTQTI